MASRKRSTGSAKAPPPAATEGIADDFRQQVRASMKRWAKEGKKEPWLHGALELGDPQYWPQIRQAYQDQSHQRWMILFHLRFYWTQYEDMVAPVIRMAMQDPRVCDEAIQLAEVFTSLQPDVLASLRDPECFARIYDSLPQVIACSREQPELAIPLVRNALRDPRCAHKAVLVAAAHPALAEEVVAYIQNPGARDYLTADEVVSCLASLFGLVEWPNRRTQYFWGGVDPVLDSVREELKRRYSLDLDEFVTGYSWY